jgi:hypothetical protein
MKYVVSRCRGERANGDFDIPPLARSVAGMTLLKWIFHPALKSIVGMAVVSILLRKTVVKGSPMAVRVFGAGSEIWWSEVKGGLGAIGER